MLKRRTNKVAKSRLASVSLKKRGSKNNLKANLSYADRQSDLQHLERIFELMEKHEVAELEWERSGERLKLKTRYASPEQILVPSSSFSPSSHTNGSLRFAQDMGMDEKSGRMSGIPNPSGETSQAAGAPKSPGMGTNQKQVLSPFVGTFYRSPSPDSDPYVKEGQAIKRGDVLCVIEAMKLMNEIEAEFPGKIVSILVENGQPVEFGEPLFVVEP